jgi:hypothetical protein
MVFFAEELVEVVVQVQFQAQVGGAETEDFQELVVAAEAAH